MEKHEQTRNSDQNRDIEKKEPNPSEGEGSRVEPDVVKPARVEPDIVKVLRVEPDIVKL